MTDSMEELRTLEVLGIDPLDDELLFIDGIDLASVAYVPRNRAARRRVSELLAGAETELSRRGARGARRSSAIVVRNSLVVGSPGNSSPTLGNKEGSNLATWRPIAGVKILPPTDLPAIGTEVSDFLRFYRAPARRPALRRILVGALLVALVAGVVLWSTIGSHRTTAQPARVSVAASSAGTAITLVGGPIDFSQLRRSLTQSGNGNLITSVPGGSVVINTDIIVGRRATLTITGSALLLRSDAQTHVRLSAEGGSLIFDDDTITSWTAQGAIDVNPIGGRADIVAIGHRAELNFTNCHVVGLGTDADDPGVSWRRGASGTVRDSQFSENWRAAYAYKSGPLNILDSSFTASNEDGILLLDPGNGSTIQDSTFASNNSGLVVSGTVGNLTLVADTADSNRYAGLLVRVAAGDVAVTDGLFYNNRVFGISATGGRLSLDGTKVWSNKTGVSLDGGNDEVTGSDLSANTLDGMYVTGSGTAVTASADRFDHNSRSGVWVTDGRVTVAGGFFDENLTGIRVDGFSHSFSAEGNTITNSIKDGVALDIAPGVRIWHNIIDDNGAAAISTNKAYDVSHMLKQNTISDNHTATRIRAS